MKYKACCTPRLFQYASRHYVLRQQRSSCDAGGGCFLKWGSQKRETAELHVKNGQTALRNPDGHRKSSTFATFGSGGQRDCGKGRAFEAHPRKRDLRSQCRQRIHTRRLDVEACPTVTESGATGRRGDGVSAAGTSFCLTVGGKNGRLKTRLLGACNA